MRIVILVAGLAACAFAGVARADGPPDAPDPVAGAGGGQDVDERARGARGRLVVGFAQFGVSRDGYVGALSREFSAAAVAANAAAGVRFGDVSIAMGLEFGAASSPRPERHTSNLLKFGYGPEARYFTRGGSIAQPYVRLGARRISLTGNQPVRRLCAESSTCSAGFFEQVPRYTGLAIRVGGGVQLAFAEDAFYGGLFVDAGYDHQRFEVVEHIVTGGVFNVMVGGVVGGGRTPRRARRLVD